MGGREKALEYLQRDEIYYVDMLEPIKRCTADILYAQDDGVIIYEKVSEACIIALDHPCKLENLIDWGKYNLFSTHSSGERDVVLAKKPGLELFEAYQTVYTLKTPVEIGDFDIRQLDMRYFDEVSGSCDPSNGPGYVSQLIESGAMWGAFQDGNLAGFIGQHAEGTMGLLKILPEYRRNGYGFALEGFLINHTLSLGYTPFCQVIVGNDQSLALQRKLGMTVGEKTIYWIY